jgi:branched-chain amino acid transport system ATP-binding protein
MFILETKNLTKHFDGVKAVDGLSISIEKGKITGIIGPNGSGKTTLINLLSGMFPFNSGAIVVGEAEKLDKIRPYDIFSFGITRTFQNVRLFEQMPVLDNILVVLTKRNVVSSLFEKHRDFHIKQAEDILNKIGLLEKKNQLAANLSYGQRKLLEIGRALAMNAEIYLLDEPFAGLFPQMVETVSKIINELKQEGKTVILIEHNMNLIRKISDYVLVMDSGKLLSEGEPDKVLARKDVIEAYLGE